MDEKAFILGQASAMKRTMTREAFETGQIVGASQDGSREFISVLAGICADGSNLPPALIYRGTHTTYAALGWRMSTALRVPPIDKGRREATAVSANASEDD